MKKSIGIRKTNHNSTFYCPAYERTTCCMTLIIKSINYSFHNYKHLHFIEDDNFRPYLMSYGRARTDYINAVIIPVSLYFIRFFERFKLKESKSYWRFYIFVRFKTKKWSQYS